MRRRGGARNCRRSTNHNWGACRRGESGEESLRTWASPSRRRDLDTPLRCAIAAVFRPAVSGLFAKCPDLQRRGGLPDPPGLRPVAPRCHAGGLHAQMLPANAGQHREDCGNALATTDQGPVLAPTATRLGLRSSSWLSIGRGPSLKNRVRDFPFDHCPRRLLDCLPGRRRLGRRCRSAWNRTRGGSGDCRGTRDTMRRATLPGKECSPGNVPPRQSRSRQQRHNAACA